MLSARQPKLASELAQIAIECSKKGWDGYQAEPVSMATCDRAMCFLASLPTWMTAPDLVPEADGQIALEWYQASGRTLSISIGEVGPLNYAGLFGDNQEMHGVEPFLDSVPSRLFGLITAFLSTQAGR
jgi:hypothetical protein